MGDEKPWVPKAGFDQATRDRLYEEVRRAREVYGDEVVKAAQHFARVSPYTFRQALQAELEAHRAQSLPPTLNLLCGADTAAVEYVNGGQIILRCEPPSIKLGNRAHRRRARRKR